MATAAQLQANRVNAQASTGPKTEQGKARSAQNARKHGLTTKDLVVREHEREEFDELQSDLEREIRPVGVVEQVIFNQLIRAAWDMRRIPRLEAELFDGEIDPLQNEAKSAQLDRLARYLTRAERSYYRAINELRRLQTDRAVEQRQAGFAESVAARSGMPGLAKRTQVDRALERAIEDYVNAPLPSLPARAAERPVGTA